MAESYEIRLTAEKGYGVFATKDIEAGTVILTDAKIMRIRSTWYKPARTRHILKAFSKLSRLDKDHFMKLHDTESEKKTVRGIFHTNSFGDEETSWVYLSISRFNHACTPNADVGLDGSEQDCVRATALISAGDGITISYRPDICELWPRAQRRMILEDWGFICRCSACDRTDYEVKLSDARRKIVWALYWRKDFIEPVDYSLFEDFSYDQYESAVNLVQRARTKTPTAKTSVAHHLLLAYALEAEGVEKGMFTNAYHNAAEALLHDLKQVNDNVFLLQYALNVRSWMLKAIQYSSDHYGPHDIRTKHLQEQWGKYRLVPQLELVLHIATLLYLAKLPKSRVTIAELVKGYRCDMAHAQMEPPEDMQQASGIFALRFIPSRNKAAIKLINERECKENVRQQHLNGQARARAKNAMEKVMCEWKGAVCQMAASGDSSKGAGT
ncbi:hypothetical protein CLAFUW4_07084 [Fulvia fulva]|uniref:SET domain-containing protein n=1 Tax=Passalora fulva TaxID=5499 RepID=A0A9Q8UR06_PASFU|nr:uncharacterized protein CLAFUR5_07220 [Fulvia fulva]KAK4622149.1 hypothetical protein CLAFUR4_07093 [Fulvia fulva]KAK4622939.1 hypothetical protein CLAFUR0_07091 [Fulvia fulva]UJO19210.1 hypothetical protein CLAFUR5_07220 [Fulvia fulva]WPV16593.1 hypothetical protein CLAFUW4_07084 [Fulvia fulva]WPV30897.1 hypothetical protein CLAFUW7_07084 [Fulvia fulva]